MNQFELLAFSASGAILGLTAGISPGPVLALVISETLRKDRKAGIKVALSPLITDLPIILISLLVLKGLDQLPTVFGVISIAGGCFILYLGYDCLKSNRKLPDPEDPVPNSQATGSLIKGISANLMNPHPYLFWITVGGPIIYKAGKTGFLAVLSYFLSFYLLLVGSKVVIALLTERSKSFLKKRGYIWVMRILGVALFVFAALFIADGLKILAQN